MIVDDRMMIQWMIVDDRMMIQWMIVDDRMMMQWMIVDDTSNPPRYFGERFDRQSIRSGIASLLSAGLMFHDTGRYALQRAASGLLQRPAAVVRWWGENCFFFFLSTSKLMKKWLALFDCRMQKWEN